MNIRKIIFVLLVLPINTLASDYADRIVKALDLDAQIREIYELTIEASKAQNEQFISRFQQQMPDISPENFEKIRAIVDEYTQNTINAVSKLDSSSSYADTLRKNFSAKDLEFLAQHYESADAKKAFRLLESADNIAFKNAESKLNEQMENINSKFIASVTELRNQILREGINKTGTSRK